MSCRISISKRSISSLARFASSIRSISHESTQVKPFYRDSVHNSFIDRSAQVRIRCIVGSPNFDTINFAQLDPKESFLLELAAQFFQ